MGVGILDISVLAIFVDMRTDVRTKIFGVAVILLTLTLSAIFW